ncbi:class I SAM-dependent DNA methyltransferase [Alloiococcus sp. CFN-8]|uniref:class I SAM-dependent DNA methyltransferase n=1 Tax=Alloiococcus sp. CFN-8 TaxID=3416081 RepID=UPI003CEB2B04
MNNETLKYYDNNAESFSSSTFSVDFQEVQEKFIKYLSPGAKILDFGCGSGRDTKYFFSKGFDIEAVDGSPELCRVASKNTGIEVKQMLFQEFSAREEYDGIWACASILHLPMEELKAVFHKLYEALKSEGILYASFKYGDFEGLRNGRYFTDINEERLQSLLQEVRGFTVIEIWISEDVRIGRENEKWLNCIVKKAL